ncbi:MAG: hypothetical protein LBI41_02660 [Lactobacillales bacterium]|jgi:hypothetical protein|nr:hypothetical protein [Lactobacillales bacterium]
MVFEKIIRCDSVEFSREEKEGIDAELNRVSELSEAEFSPFLTVQLPSLIPDRKLAPVTFSEDLISLAFSGFSKFCHLEIVDQLGELQKVSLVIDNEEQFKNAGMLMKKFGMSLLKFF